LIDVGLGLTLALLCLKILHFKFTAINYHVRFF
jgi:hypothetical protein